MGEKDFAIRLAWLFDNVRKENGRRYTSAEVAAAVGISPAHLRKLKIGLTANPGKNLIENLADFFGVNPAFFVDREPADPESLYSTNQIGDETQPDPLELLEQIALRAADSDKLDQQTLGEMLEAIRRLRKSK